MKRVTEQTPTESNNNMSGGNDGGATASPRASPPRHGDELTPLERIELHLLRARDTLLKIKPATVSPRVSPPRHDNELTPLERSELHLLRAKSALLKIRPRGRTTATATRPPARRKLAKLHKQLLELQESLARRKRSTTVASPTPVLPPEKVAGVIV